MCCVEEQRKVTREELDDWTFAKVSPTTHIHGVHGYPARMHPLVASKAIRLFASHGNLILDPFCGSGGVLAEAKIQGYRSVGLDINPLACLITRVKTTPINPDILYQEGRLLQSDIKDELSTPRLSKIETMLNNISEEEDKEVKTSIIDNVEAEFERMDVKVPNFSTLNVFYWFKPKTITELSVIKNRLDRVEKNEIREFFHVCFSKTVRQVSGTRKGEFKLYRIPKNKWKEHNPDTLNLFSKIFAINISKMAEFYELCEKKNVKDILSLVLHSDSRKMFSDEFSKKGKDALFEKNCDEVRGKVDLIVTSPPYGDSRTTVAYGQFSRYSSFWLGYPKEDYFYVDKVSIGGWNKEKELSSVSLEKTLDVIRLRDQNRAKEVKSFFVDLNECLVNLYKILVEGGIACFVLGNRTVKNTRIPTDKIIVELGEPIGFKLKNTFSRKIPTKRPPWKTSPSNIRGQTVNTIAEENIIVLRR